MRLGLVQHNPTVGDIPSNAAEIADWAGRAAAEGVDLCVFPELALAGYPPRDLLNQEGFCERVRDEAVALAGRLGDIAPGATVLVGAPWKPPEGRGVADPAAFDPEARTTNALLVCRAGRVVARYDKRLLPTYDVFDEDRYFAPGDRPVVIEAAGVRVGLSICEDLWRGVDVAPEQTARDRYLGRADPVRELVGSGASLIVNPSASPFVLGKGPRQREIVARHVAAHGVAVATVNQVGGNDDLIFDGHAAVYAPAGVGPQRGARLVAAGPGFETALVTFDFDADRRRWGESPEVADPRLEAEPEWSLWRALVLGVRDYARKTGFRAALLGLSGGIDSALTAAVAAAALGRENVLGVAMPSRYSSDHSVEDAVALGEAVGLRVVTAPIEPAHGAMESLLGPVFEGAGAGAIGGVTDENLQSRLRGVIVMALSNATGALLLTTGNKSELAVGYCTLYGDMNGGLGVLSDVTKVQVTRLSRWINDNHARCGFERPPIPVRTIEKPPSAELRPDQLDSDSLPPYETLDEIVDRYVAGEQAPSRIVAETGFDPAVVARICRLIDVNEYKRKQAPIGLKVSSVAFGRGRRRPLAQNYRPDRELG